VFDHIPTPHGQPKLEKKNTIRLKIKRTVFGRMNSLHHFGTVKFFNMDIHLIKRSVYLTRVQTTEIGFNLHEIDLSHFHSFFQGPPILFRVFSIGFRGASKLSVSTFFYFLPILNFLKTDQSAQHAPPDFDAIFLHK
jgi:hypothetical protein